MKIRLDEKWFLTGDSNQFILAVEKKQNETIVKDGKKIKTGNQVIALEGQYFFRNLSDALKEFATMKLRVCNATNFKEFAVELKKTNELLTEIKDAVNFQLK